MNKKIVSISLSSSLLLVTIDAADNDRVPVRPAARDSLRCVAMDVVPPQPVRRQYRSSAVEYRSGGHPAGNTVSVGRLSPKFQSQLRSDALGGVTVVQGRTGDGKPFLAVPFYALANRGNSIQEVWLYQAGKRNRNDGWEGKLYHD